MSASNVLPSAPPETGLYPNISSDNFWLTKISKIEKEIADDTEHYRLVLKNIKRPGKQYTMPRSASVL